MITVKTESYQLVVISGIHAGKEIEKVSERDFAHNLERKLHFSDGSEGYVPDRDMGNLLPDGTLFTGWKMMKSVGSRVMFGAEAYKEIHPRHGVHRCRVCGQYIEDGEEYYEVMIGGTSRGRFDFLIHAEEWLTVLKEADSFKEAVDQVFSKAQPKPKNVLVEDVQKTKLVRKALKELSLTITEETKNHIYFTPYPYQDGFLSYNRLSGKFQYGKCDIPGIKSAGRLFADIQKKVNQFQNEEK